MLRSPLPRSACVFGAVLAWVFPLLTAAPLGDPANERRLEALLAQMTLEEKVAQLHQLSSTFDVTGPVPADGAGRDRLGQIQRGEVGSMLNVVGADVTRRAQEMALAGSRLKIPMLFGYDVVHGFRTVFPIPVGEAASWNLELIERSAHIAAIEAGASGLHWTFAPMVDVGRDARWGRVMEGAGEDPWLGAQIAVARVRGFQGKDLASPDAIAACAKHFAGYAFAESGRDYNTTDFSESTLRNVVLVPFHAAVNAGVATLMNSFNEIGGTPATASVHLQRDILKGEWGFSGFVVSDWGSINELVAHGFARDRADAGRLALTAGNDMDMETDAYHGHLAAMVRAGVIDEKVVDEAVRRVLRVKFAVGLFDDPYARCDRVRESRVLGLGEHFDAARAVARNSIVLLKNDGGLLPIAPTVKRLAVIGSFAADKDTPLGSWRGWAVPGSAVSVLEGLCAAAPEQTEVEYAEGVKLSVGKREFHHELTFNTTDRSGFAEAVALARKSDLVVLVVGEEAMQTGEGRSQTDLGLKGVQDDLVRAVLEANPRTVVVLMNGRPLVIPWIAEHAPAIVEAWHLGSEAGHALADVLFGEFEPVGRLPMSFPRSVGQIPVYYNHKSTGRPLATPDVFWSHYTDSPNDPLFPFGFGLGYTTFAWSPVKLSAASMTADGSIEAAVTLTNTGQRPGMEIVQFYLRDVVASTTRPVKELKGFQRVSLAPGESREVKFTIRVADLVFWSARGRWEAEPGEFRVMLGRSSADVQEASFELK